jgi:hypothetical protein
MATVVSYLNACVANPAMKQHYWEQMLQYLAASCWPKMYTRVMHWSSLGFLHHLSVIPDDVIHSAYNQYIFEGTPKGRDSNLTTLFLALEREKGLLESIMKEHPNPVHRSSRLIHLSNAFKSANDSTTAIHIYNRDTCVEFHHFLVALLAAYIKSLRALHASQTMTLGLKFYNLACAVFKVACSNMLRTHLDVLQASELQQDLVMPNEQAKNIYLANAPGGRKTRAGEKQEDGEEENDDNEVFVECSKARDDNGGPGPGPMSLVYRRWCVLLVAQFDGLKTLTKAYAHMKNIEVQVLGIRPTLSPRKMNDWKTTILGLVESPESQVVGGARHFSAALAEQIIKILTEVQGQKEASLHSIINNFRKGFTFRGKVHCETTMGACIRFFPLVNCPTGLSFCKVWFHFP